MQFGIRDGMLRKPDLESTFAAARELGFDGIELCVGNDYASNPLWDRRGIALVKKLVEQSGVEACSISLGGWSPVGYKAEESKREEGQRMLSYVIPVAREIGADVILVPFFGQYELESADVRNPVVTEGLRELAPLAAQHQVHLALEGTLPAEDWLQIIRQVGSPFVSVYYDVGNSTAFGYDAAAEIRLLDQHISMIHFKDTDGKHLGQGSVDFEACVAAIAGIGYDHWIVLETPTGENPAAANKANLDFCRRCFPPA